jgi:hypothetical protein
MGVILEEGGGGAIVVAEVVEGSAGERADVRVGDVLRACSAVTRGIRYGGAAAPEAGSALGRRPAEPFERFSASRDFPRLVRGSSAARSVARSASAGAAGLPRTRRLESSSGTAREKSATRGLQAPELRRTLVPCDMQPFDDVMDSVRSNLDAPVGDPEVVLILERGIK